MTKIKDIINLTTPVRSRIRDAIDADERVDGIVARFSQLAAMVGTDLATKLKGHDVRRVVDGLSMREILTLDPVAFDRELAGAIQGSGYDANGCEIGNHTYIEGCGTPLENCGEDTWAIDTIGAAGFPLLGTGALVTAVLQPRLAQNSFTVRHVHLAVVDFAAAARPRVAGVLTQVQIQNSNALIGSGIQAYVFEDIADRVPVRWKRIDASSSADYTFGQYYPVGVNVHFFLCQWGIPNAPAMTQGRTG